MDSKEFAAHYRKTIQRFLKAEEDHHRQEESLAETSKSRKETLQRTFDNDLKKSHAKRDRELQEIKAYCSSQLDKARKHITAIGEVKGKAQAKLAEVGLESALPQYDPAPSGDTPAAESFSSLLAAMEQTARQAATEEARLAEAVNRLAAYQNRFGKMRRLKMMGAAAVGGVVLISAVFFGFDWYKQHQVQQVYQRAEVALQQGSWGLVRSEIAGLTGLDFNPGGLCGPLFNWFGCGDVSKYPLRLALFQREALYRTATEAYSAGRWQEAIDIFKEMGKHDRLCSIHFASYKTVMQEYSKERNLREYFNNFTDILHESLYKASLDGLKRGQSTDAYRLFRQLPKNDKYYSLGMQNHDLSKLVIEKERLITEYLKIPTKRINELKADIQANIYQKYDSKAAANLKILQIDLKFKHEFRFNGIKFQLNAVLYNGEDNVIWEKPLNGVIIESGCWSSSPSFSWKGEMSPGEYKLLLYYKGELVANATCTVG
jgi:hypothetical protein